MFGNVNTYLNAVQRTWAAQDGRLVATFLSLRDRHATNPNLQIEFPDNLVERLLDSPIDEILSAHMKVLFYLSCERKWLLLDFDGIELILMKTIVISTAKDYMEAYKYQTQCAQAVVKMLQVLKDENWCLPIMYTVCLDLRLLAQKCEDAVSGNVSKPGELLEKAAECLMGCFRVCAADNRWLYALFLERKPKRKSFNQ